MYVPGLFELYLMLTFDDGDEGHYTQALIRQWRTVFRGVRRHRQVPDDVLHYHRSRGITDRAMTESIIVHGGLSVFVRVSADSDQLSSEFDRCLERLEKALDRLPELPMVQVTASVEIAMNAPEGSTPLSGPQLFLLPHRVQRFGDHYDVSLAFYWKLPSPPEARIVARVMPMDSDSHHVHCRYSIHGGDAGTARTKYDETTSLLRQCFEHAPQLATAVLLPDHLE